MFLKVLACLYIGLYLLAAFLIYAHNRDEPLQERTFQPWAHWAFVGSLVVFFML